MPLSDAEFKHRIKQARDIFGDDVCDNERASNMLEAIRRCLESADQLVGNSEFRPLANDNAGAGRR